MLDLSRVRRTRTFPVARSKVSVKLAWGSCFQGAASVIEPLLVCIANENAALYCDLGDYGYLNIRTNDLGLARSLVTRKANASASMDALLRTTAIMRLPSNHDTAEADAMRGDVYPDGTTFDQVCGVTRPSFRETTPHYPFLQVVLGETDLSKVILTQCYWVGNIYVIGIDTASQREAGSILGSYLWPNHKQAFKDALAYANAMQADAIVILCPNTWNTAKFNSWQATAPAEQTEICNFIRDTVTYSLVILCVGDMHQGMVDDGTNADKSTGGTGRFPMLVSSPIQVASIYDEGICSWNGQVLKTIGVHSLYGVLEFEYVGGAFSRWTCKIKGDPIAGTTATTLISVASDDAENVVAFPSATIPAASANAIPLTKTWFGRRPGGSQVTYTTSKGQSGTILIGANCNRVTLPSTLGLVAGDTVTISGPVRCALGSQTTITIAA